MNLIEALKSGKRFKRNRTHKASFWHDPLHVLRGMGMEIEDILATDWEIEERKIELTESEFEEACFDISKQVSSTHLYALKKRLFDK